MLSLVVIALFIHFIHNQIKTPPNCECVKSSARGLCEEIYCPCTCDLTSGKCDYGCCCDKDCQGFSNIFQSLGICPLIEERQSDINYCETTSDTPTINQQTPINWMKLLESFICVRKTNVNSDSYYKLYQGYNYDNYQWPSYTNSEIQSHIRSTDPVPYKSSDNIVIFNGVGLDYFKLPIQGFSNKCILQPMKYNTKFITSGCYTNTQIDLEALRKYQFISHKIPLNESSYDDLKVNINFAVYTSSGEEVEPTSNVSVNELLYTIEINFNGPDNFTITNSTLIITLSDIQSGYVHQRSSLNVVNELITPSDNQSYLINRSGNPGYIFNKPVIVVDMSESFHPLYKFYLPDINIASLGECQNKTYKHILFGENTDVICLLSNYTCDENIPNLQFADNYGYYQYGNPTDAYFNDSLSQKIEGTSLVAGGNCKNGFKFIFYIEDTGKYPNSQYKISLSRAIEKTYYFDKPPSPLPFYFKIRFVYRNNKELAQNVPPLPRWRIELRPDIFSPFNVPTE